MSSKIFLHSAFYRSIRIFLFCIRGSDICNVAKAPTELLLGLYADPSPSQHSCPQGLSRVWTGGSLREIPIIRMKEKFHKREPMMLVCEKAMPRHIFLAIRMGEAIPEYLSEKFQESSPDPSGKLWGPWRWISPECCIPWCRSSPKSLKGYIVLLGPVSQEFHSLAFKHLSEHIQNPLDCTIWCPWLCSWVESDQFSHIYLLAIPVVVPSVQLWYHL